MRVNDLHQSRHGLPHGLSIACVEMNAKGKVPVDNLGEVMLAQIAKCFGQVVHHKAVVICEQIVPHLRYLPTRKIEMQTVNEGHVITDYVRHWRKQVTGLNHHVDRLVGITEHSDAGISSNSFLPTLEGAGFAVCFHRSNDFLWHLLEI